VARAADEAVDMPPVPAARVGYVFI
jgi:hypothetical protein